MSNTILVLLLSLCCTIHALPSHGGAEVYVHTGQSIQSAINAAQAGTRIKVGAGTYAEQLTISKDGIALIGDGATLVPPAVPAVNTCTGIAGGTTSAGICVTGSGIELAPFVTEHQKVLSVEKPVTDVFITGFNVNDFDGANILVVGGEDTRVADNNLYNGGQYGFLAAGSTNTVVSKNNVVSEESLRYIAICTDNFSGARVVKNHISGYSVGLCVQTSGSEIAFNEVTNGCVGSFVDPNVNGAQVVHNSFGASNPACIGQSPIIGGVVIFAADNTNVQSNVIRDQRAGGVAAGIVLVDALEFGPDLVANDNKIVDNVLVNNDYDIFVNTTGTGNVIADNQCTLPAELCA
ncbi:hypothetical protein LTR51_000034 [Lithohypha guttulata]|nr:hypothetical protein LTR51_000034 [Lithohypha guttulata]